jgi:hypothetical protein
LTGWKINDGDGATNHTFNPPPKNSSRGSFILEPGQFAILAGDGATVIADLPQYAGTVIDTVLSLNNTSATIKIFNAEGLEINSATYEKSMGATGNGKTLELKSSGWQESAAEGGTPGQANSSWSAQNFFTPAPSPSPETNPSPSPSPSNQTSQEQENYSPAPIYDYSQDVYLNEFYPYPGADEKEWAELYNQGSQTVDLTGWQIDDTENSNSPQKISDGAKIEPGDFLVITFEKSIFNNDADQVRLIWPDDQVIHSISYPKAIKNSSCSRFGGQWLWTNQPTPGKANKKSITILNERASSPSPSTVPAPKAQTLIQEAPPPQKNSPARETAEQTPETEIKSEPIEGTSNNPSDYLAAQSVAFDPKQKKTNDWWLILGLAALGGIFGLGFVWFKKQSSPPHSD